MLIYARKGRDKGWCDNFISGVTERPTNYQKARICLMQDQQQTFTFRKWKINTYCIIDPDFPCLCKSSIILLLF